MINKILAWLLLLILFSCSSPSTKDPELIIAAASNTQFALAEITERFTEKTGVECQLILGSSGKLTAQIRQGAPFDIFLSADMKYPDALFGEGFGKERPGIYAYGKLVLWTKDENLEPSLLNLEDSRIRHIAFANPDTAPYGKAAMQVLRTYGWHDKLKHKFVFGESISQVNHFVDKKAAEIGFTALAVIQGLPEQKQGKWEELPPTSYSPIAQGAVIVHETEKAELFYRFLFSKEGQDILKKYGYSI